jgi:thiol:disulfide interchange protein DsbA
MTPTFKPHLLLALCAALALSACTEEPKPEAATPAETAPAAGNDAQIMADAAAVAAAASDPNAAPAAPAADPAAPAPTPAPPPVAPAGIAGLVKGTDYEEIPNGQPFEPLNGKIEVVEVYNHVCPACAGFQPLLLNWKKTMPADVRFTYVPAAFGGNWDQYVRSYYAAQTLGIADKAHEAVYDAIHLKGQLKGERGEDSDEALAKFYSQFGADEKKFLATFRSFAVTSKVNRAKQFIVNGRINSTPTMVVNGRYKVRGRTLPDVLRNLDVLIAHERAQASAPAAAPAGAP